ncbi:MULTISPECIES: MarR family winged helix-turn-helix transcriptional regulator [Streptomyces]|uniref:MarR family winged helix-turn-helix transcriptional regulator n=1 Tax=Streptomyces TaxID=1883 RepID=UPI00163C4F4B|nr:MULTISPECIES: MarR family transcriptional regulator [Streptomyces]MBC2879056.1 MarR family transcriptional regulator [Streptomyces sp. TYQ1024]UBI36088.1 MarR family transcriptional regulator [Streptomyces mobaraensis]UKW28683.1 MarR family transcriptional regulator [Streptomyces sp. TYQ1024]
MTHENASVKTSADTPANASVNTSRNGTAAPAAPTAPAQPPIALVASRATEAILRHSQAALAGIDLTQPQWWALNNVVRAEHGLTRDEIRAVDVPYGMGTEVTAHAADALVHRGWLAADADGRLTLTDRGLAGLATAKERMARVREEIVGDITEEEYATAVSVLRRVTDHLA